MRKVADTRTQRLVTLELTENELETLILELGKSCDADFRQLYGDYSDYQPAPALPLFTNLKKIRKGSL